MFKIAVLVSGGGSNLQSIIEKSKSGELACEVACVIGDRECYGVERAAEQGITSCVLDRKVFKKELCREIDRVVSEKEVDLIVLAGFLSIIDEEFVEKWKGKIINIHPSLLPKFGGPGMYGIKVHEAVLAAGEKESGCTVHYVDNGVDSGEIIFQVKVPVMEGDTAEILQKRILVEEHKLLPKSISKIISER
ncbi:MAG: phosphoribosylglycinamide formyltransferase [Fusobacterium varium]|jgi:phosphoribosylglycinamide formyltransferase-1|uniref:Phosphoribosylglycinamide formyltransferase n=2 Tax=Fusobacterium TaxID=848 RepID=A0ABN5JIL6_FUSVA|nr:MULTISPECIES: phosphoribosylglycinamide formyltransferase [Fusobacterium]MCD7979985.1 phosphoribosylglycinamide formyltransferase [Fusobacterium sp.]AVQ32095.1 phosphoribosylglycinamide formyltransferase [Fusobacterium varium ATCC 27725]EES63464.1 phosphoribosylglycinamide formyltransferase [Fusobacterium varium ATCC 27725]MCF2674216.1 phosphoribosylglycinamide formyltransferase [Fusobacterium varium]MCI6031975.1 phosphoribosylglycinamide formyltransferase [Fusobacterium varium]